MDTAIRLEIFEKTKEWIYQAGDNIRKQIYETYHIDTKADANDLVTDVDKSTEQFFVNKIRKEYPSHRILGEEGYGDEIDSLDGIIWIIDPIDGTMNFVHQKKNFAISIGIFQEGIGEIAFIYDVMADVLYSAQKGQGAYRNDEKLAPLDEKITLDKSIIALNSIITCENKRINEKKIHQLIRDCRSTRSYGSAALEFAYVAEGSIDAYITLKLAPWDFAAGLILIKEVGGQTTQLNDKPVQLLEKSSIITSNKNIHQKIIENYIEWK